MGEAPDKRDFWTWPVVILLCAFFAASLAFGDFHHPLTHAPTFDIKAAPTQAW